LGVVAVDALPDEGGVFGAGKIDGGDAGADEEEHEEDQEGFGHIITVYAYLRLDYYIFTGV
jgi:hypothetical protein